MRFIILALLLAGCTKSAVTTASLREDGLKNCEKVPELDMQKMFCVWSYVKVQCQLQQYDTRICGEMEQR